MIIEPIKCVHAKAAAHQADIAERNALRRAMKSR
jgi:hypothetical protein